MCEQRDRENRSLFSLACLQEDRGRGRRFLLEQHIRAAPCHALRYKRRALWRTIASSLGSQICSLSHSSREAVPCAQKKATEFLLTFPFPEKALYGFAEGRVHGLQSPERKDKEISPAQGDPVSRHIVTPRGT